MEIQSEKNRVKDIGNWVEKTWHMGTDIITGDIKHLVDAVDILRKKRAEHQNGIGERYLEEKRQIERDLAAAEKELEEAREKKSNKGEERLIKVPGLPPFLLPGKKRR